MEKSQLAMGTRPTVYSMPRAEKYDASNACCSGAVTFRMFRAAASGETQFVDNEYRTACLAIKHHETGKRIWRMHFTVYYSPWSAGYLCTDVFIVGFFVLVSHTIGTS